MSRDLMHGSEVKALVRDAYRHVPPTTAAVAYKLYSAEELAMLPASAIQRALGVANHLRYADIQPGEAILDLGCGGGIDTILAAHRTGPTGKVIALDFLPEMLDRTAHAVQEAGFSNVELVEAEMEAIPCPDASVDLIISNGVINLSARKARVMAECARVLRPGGRLCGSDLTVERNDLPPEIATQPAAWAGCVAGALAEDAFLHKLARAGFEGAEVVYRAPLSIDDCALYPLFSDGVIRLMRTLIPVEHQAQVAVAVVIKAQLPEVPTVRSESAALGSQAVTANNVRRLRDITPGPADIAGVEVRHLTQVEDLELKVIDIEPGSSTPFHTHPHAHDAVIVSGVGALRLDGREEALEPGDVLVVKPDEPHAIVNRGSEVLRFVCLDCYLD
jgi:SAM-dependent methyltransferase/quercetin dioxygenase-like cupin family protein